MPEDNDNRLFLLQEGRTREQIAFVHRNFGKTERKNAKNSKLAMLSLEASMTHKERLQLLQTSLAANQAGMPWTWKNDVQGILAIRFAAQDSLPAKILLPGDKQNRLHILRFGRLSDQLAAVFLSPAPNAASRGERNAPGDLPKLEENPDHPEALPPSEGLVSEEKNSRLALKLPESITPENAELWRYEIAQGRDFVKNSFLDEQGADPDVPYSIPAFFPTHQWIEIVLDEGQWVDDAAEGEWQHKKIATRPVDL